MKIAIQNLVLFRKSIMDCMSSQYLLPAAL